MNLSTARAAKRAKEVGVRKVIGAAKKDLVKQFLGESILLSLIGVLVALPLLIIAIPYLNQITQADIRLSLFNDPELLLVLLALILITGLVAGSYPAFYLSAFKAIKVIKGNFTNHISAAGIRRSLVVFQFVLSIVLISGIIVIYSQLNYMKKMDIGFDTNQRMIFSFYTNDSQSKMESFMGDLRQLADIKAVSKSNNYLSQFVFNDRGLYLAGEDMAHGVDAQNMTTDENFVKANGIKLVSGRDFRLTDSGKVLVNEALVKSLGLKNETAPGTILYSQYAPDPVQTFQIAGVMKDFNFNSLHSEVAPFMLEYNLKNPFLTNLTVAANSKNYKSLLSEVEKIWKKDIPGAPFEYAFLDQEVQKQYETEITLSNIINAFTIMAIFISCLGLFGLAAFSAEQRNKEIGVRKVLGASVFSITTLLSKDFLRLVSVAILIAVPIAWWAMHKWLQSFAYKVDISWWMFGLAGLLAICIALFTVSFQAIKAAISNPVRSLRSE
jgi:putative ABC transport system permease protein